MSFQYLFPNGPTISEVDNSASDVLDVNGLSNSNFQIAGANHPNLNLNGIIPQNLNVQAPAHTASLRTGLYSGAAAKNVPVFLNKLFNMVSDPSSDQYIRWTEEGNSFIVCDAEEFAQNILPLYFKHNNFTSFVRQLNMYRFHKVPHLQHGTMRADKREELWEFSNPYFVRGQPDRLCFVQRKKGREDEEKEDSIDANRILHELAALRKHQLTISEEFKALQKNNELLWREAKQMREKHDQQQKYMANIIEFFQSKFFQGKVGRNPVTGKELSSQESRKPLMIESGKPSETASLPDRLPIGSQVYMDDAFENKPSNPNPNFDASNIDSILQPGLFQFPIDPNFIPDLDSVLTQPAVQKSEDLHPPHKRKIFESTLAGDDEDNDSMLPKLVGITPSEDMQSSRNYVKHEPTQPKYENGDPTWPYLLNEY